MLSTRRSFVATSAAIVPVVIVVAAAPNPCIMRRKMVSTMMEQPIKPTIGIAKMIMPRIPMILRPLVSMRLPEKTRMIIVQMVYPPATRPIWPGLKCRSLRYSGKADTKS